VPPIKDKYDGISGRQHGERNEQSPAANASKIDNSLILSVAPFTARPVFSGYSGNKKNNVTPLLLVLH
jgi:hypothetical protein